MSISRRQALASAGPLALALASPATAKPCLNDPAVTAFQHWQAKSADAVAAYERASEKAPAAFVEVPLASGGCTTAFNDFWIDFTIERQREAANGFALEIPTPTPDQIKRRDYVRLNPYSVRAEPLKQQLAELLSLIHI